MIDNIDELKRQWQQMQVGAGRLEDANRLLSHELSTRRVSSLQDHMVRRIKRERFLGLFVILYTPVVYYGLNMPLWVCLLYAMFGLVMTLLNYFYGSYVESERLVELPVADALLRAVKIKVYQQRIHMVGICAAILVLCPIIMILADAGEEAGLVGAAIGMAVGLAIGIPKMLRATRLARRLVESLSATDGADGK